MKAGFLSQEQAFTRTACLRRRNNLPAQARADRAPQAAALSAPTYIASWFRAAPAAIPPPSKETRECRARRKAPACAPLRLPAALRSGLSILFQKTAESLQAERHTRQTSSSTPESAASLSAAHHGYRRFRAGRARCPHTTAAAFHSTDIPA